MAQRRADELRIGCRPAADRLMHSRSASCVDLCPSEVVFFCSSRWESVSISGVDDERAPESADTPAGSGDSDDRGWQRVGRAARRLRNLGRWSWNADAYRSRTGATTVTARGPWDYDYVRLAEYGEGTILIATGSSRRQLIEMDAGSGTVRDT